MLRSAKSLEKSKKQRQKFPDILDKVVETSDIILEVLDARFIEKTRNLEIEKAIKKRKKPLIYVLNKADLIKTFQIPKKTIDSLRPYVFVSAIKRNGGKELRNKIKIIAKNVAKPEDKERISVGVIGYPNTGKSSIINLLTGKSSARIGAAAGFTKGIQKLKLSSNIVLLDSPGVIPDKEYSSSNQIQMSKHAIVGARDYHRIKNPELVISELVKQYKNEFEKYYKTQINDSEEFLEEVGKKSHILKKGGIVNTDQVARKILRDWQEGKISINQIHQ